MKKTLIIKTGHTETFFEFEDQGICSLGDVLRTSFILDDFSNVTWVTDKKAFGLLKYAAIDNLVDINDFDFSTLDEYDTIINLEKNEGILSRVGLCRGINCQSLSKVEELSKQAGQQSFQELLCELLEIQWRGQRYSFNFQKNEGEGIGLNWQAGVKVPEKMLPKKFWQDLADEISTDQKVLWQEGFESLDTYIHWINSCHTLITLDSLGAHIALALGKRVICLFGPTNPHEIFMYGHGEKIIHSTPVNDDILENLKKSVIQTL